MGLLSGKHLGYNLKAIMEKSDTGHVEGHSRKRNRIHKDPIQVKPGFFEKESVSSVDCVSRDNLQNEVSKYQWRFSMPQKKPPPPHTHTHSRV